MGSKLSEKFSESKSGNAGGMPQQGDPQRGLWNWLSSKLTPDPAKKEEKRLRKVERNYALMVQRWGKPGSPNHEMVMKYWVATRMREHWEYLLHQHPSRFKRMMDVRYMEPIPTAWVQSRYLANPKPEYSTFENAAEERLYYLLNNGKTPDGSRHAPLRPLNIVRDRYTIIKRGNERNARAVALDAKRLAAYSSPGDVFHSDKAIKSQQYSPPGPKHRLRCANCSTAPARRGTLARRSS
ncbi:hypothetical protein BT96DRAFT_1010040 [Gymnopus androsaceus JB14]|uniref:Uncharacterized protein n=1 Tax=Gymnopus androsaceus JB14 TaxID=1447944 RepID=A0A6A4GBD4_9AGAR|nr:hypothetical protein BT96DRAFT_1010040 [Gymnopus androsaceus JB14]